MVGLPRQNDHAPDHVSPPERRDGAGPHCARIHTLDLFGSERKRHTPTGPSTFQGGTPRRSEALSPTFSRCRLSFRVGSCSRQSPRFPPGEIRSKDTRSRRRDADSARVRKADGSAWGWSKLSAGANYDFGGAASANKSNDVLRIVKRRERAHTCRRPATLQTLHCNEGFEPALQFAVTGGAATPHRSHPKNRPRRSHETPLRHTRLRTALSKQVAMPRD